MIKLIKKVNQNEADIIQFLVIASMVMLFILVSALLSILVACLFIDMIKYLP